MEDLKRQVGQQIKEAREKRGMTQDELAAKLGTGKSTVSKYENGSINPSLELLGRIAKALGFELDLNFK